MGNVATKIVLVLAAALVSSCAAPTLVPDVRGDGPMWPEPPEQSRIEFIREFSNLEELGVGAPLLGRFVNFVVGKKADEMVRPMAVAASADEGTIFVADPDAGCVHRYDLTKGRYSCLKISSGEELWSPVGLAVDDDGRLYVADSASGLLYQVENEGKWLEQMPLELKLERPAGIFWDQDTGLLYVVDSARQSISAFTRDGVLVKDHRKRGNQEGELNFPTYVWVSSSGEILVTDTLNFRVQAFDQEWVSKLTFGVVGDVAGDFARPKGIATDSFGHIYVVDALFHALQIFDSSGNLLLSIGRRGHGPGQFWLPNGIFITRNNTIFVADSYNKRVQVFRYVGSDT